MNTTTLLEEARERSLAEVARVEGKILSKELSVTISSRDEESVKAGLSLLNKITDAFLSTETRRLAKVASSCRAYLGPPDLSRQELADVFVPSESGGGVLARTIRYKVKFGYEPALVP